jgi:hypothetical protein
MGIPLKVKAGIISLQFSTPISTDEPSRSGLVVLKNRRVWCLGEESDCCTLNRAANVHQSCVIPMQQTI